MKFSVIHPTARLDRSFEHYWSHAADSVLMNCDSPEDVEYILVVHQSRELPYAWQAGIFPHRFGRFSIVTNYGRDCLVDQCNAGQLAASGEILCWNQDDMRYPKHWDSEIRKLIPDTRQKVCIQAATDGNRPDLLTLPSILTKALADEIGPISPEYDGMFSDDEGSIKMRRMGLVIPSDLYFQHLHPVNRTAEVDAVYAMENRAEAYEIGKRVFDARRAAGFPRVILPGWERPAVSAAPETYRSIAFMLPGESFRFEWLASLLELGIAVGNAGWAIQRYLGYCTSCYSTRINLTHDLLTSAEQKPEYVFWIDDDNLVKPEQFMRLLSFLDSHPEVDGVTGWCWIRQKERWATSVGNFWPEDGVHLVPMELPQLFEGGPTVKPIQHTGFPCFLMRYSVLERLGENVFAPVTKNTVCHVEDRTSEFNTWTDWETLTDEQVGKIPNHWFAGEDGSFCLRAREAGMKFFVDPACKVAHLKMISQEPDVQLYRDTPEELKQWREQVNGKAVAGPAEVVAM